MTSQQEDYDSWFDKFLVGLKYGNRLDKDETKNIRGYIKTLKDKIDILSRTESREIVKLKRKITATKVEKNQQISRLRQETARLRGDLSTEKKFRSEYHRSYIDSHTELKQLTRQFKELERSKPEIKFKKEYIEVELDPSPILLENITSLSAEVLQLTTTLDKERKSSGEKLGELYKSSSRFNKSLLDCEKNCECIKRSFAVEREKYKKRIIFLDSNIVRLKTELANKHDSTRWQRFKRWMIKHSLPDDDDEHFR